MSEHDSTGTEQLDATFDRLVEDVETHGHARGAGAAVRAADRRRTVAGAGALVLALVLLAGVGGWTLQGTRRSGELVGGGPSVPVGTPVLSSAPPSADPDPEHAPALLTLDRLNQASAGWTRWTPDGSGSGSTKAGTSPCLHGELERPEPLRTTTLRFRSSDSGVATFQRLRYVSVADTNLAMRATVQAFEDCPEKGDSYFSGVGEGILQVVSYRWGTGKEAGVVWLINDDDRIDVLVVSGTPALPERARMEVVELVGADVQVP